MDSKLNYYEDIKTIKKIMEESSRFLSLSGLSGLFTGLTALIGGAVAYFITTKEAGTLKMQLIIDAVLVLIIAIGAAIYFSYRKSQQQGLKIWTPISKRLLINLLIPLVAGGFFIIILYMENQFHLIVPGMLIFYGLALVNACKFTYSEVFYLGLVEIMTGLVSSVFPEYAIIFWCFGFGLLHIAYGLFMYRKYEG